MRRRNILWSLPVLALVVVLVAPRAAAQAPATSLSADGRTVAGGGMSLSASQVHDLVPGPIARVRDRRDEVHADADKELGPNEESDGGDLGRGRFAISARRSGGGAHEQDYAQEPP